MAPPLGHVGRWEPCFLAGFHSGTSCKPGKRALEREHVMFPTAWASARGNTGPRDPGGTQAHPPAGEALRYRSPSFRGEAFLPLGTQIYSRRKLGAQDSNLSPSSSKPRGTNQEKKEDPLRSVVCAPGNFCGCLYRSYSLGSHPALGWAGRESGARGTSLPGK